MAWMCLAPALAGAGYRFGALEIDASAYLPQSRTRCVIIATLADLLAGHLPASCS